MELLECACERDRRIQGQCDPREAIPIRISRYSQRGGSPRSLRAATELVEQTGARVALCLVVIELDYLKGRQRLGAPLESVVHFAE
ncbi:unnamed protein product [Darwinula stevensoni]|uniref:Adenine phosphoribosyltransferase n=1 Tax=Darwinula stevensoni TaxID=69355 RepID=A0A7R9A7H1_9CRUS|nr:unnamed protein product [Darwinula stevensoni]CAG0891799.1 unnamed protein product [Darwinula stevensoni]